MFFDVLSNKRHAGAPIESLRAEDQRSTREQQRVAREIWCCAFMTQEEHADSTVPLHGPFAPFA